MSRRRNEWRSWVLLAMAIGVWWTTSAFLGFGKAKEIEAKEKFALPAEGIESIEIGTHNGGITITGSPEAREITVVAIKKVRASSKSEAEAALAAVKITTDVEGSTQKIGWTWSPAKKRNWRESVGFEITIPQGLKVAASSHNGALKLTGTDSGANLSTHNGGIEIRDQSGEVIARTHNGGITASGHAGPIDAETHNGGIRVDGSGPRLRLVTTNGGITASIPGDASLDAVMKSTNGGIAVRLGEGASAQVVCSAAHGRVSSRRELAGGSRSGNRLAGAIGSGDGRLEIETTNGSISID